jgi:hypothetical protein
MSSDDKFKILNVSRLPARLGVEQVAILLGFQNHDVPVLVRTGLLKPLGSPSANAPKYFAMSQVEACRNDEKWLSRATKVISENWRKKNRNVIVSSASATQSMS